MFNRQNLIIISTIFLLGQGAFANCQSVLEERMPRVLERNGHTYHGVEPLDARQVVSKINEAEEMTANAKGEARRILQTGKYEFYLLTASQGPGGYQELVAVNKVTCKTYRRFTVYTE